MRHLRRHDGGVDSCEPRGDGARIVGSAPPEIVDTCARCGARLACPTVVVLEGVDVLGRLKAAVRTLAEPPRVNR